MNCRIWQQHRFRLELLAFVCLCLVFCGCISRTPLHVSFSQSADSIDAYDFVEVTTSVSWPHARNPFTEAEFTGWFETADKNRKWQVDGFCDSEDASLFRIRFMPPA